MKIFFIQEAVYLEYQGKYYSNRIKYETYWDRYLEHFKSVTVLARVKKVNELPSNFHLSSGAFVDFVPLPYYKGAIGFIKKYKVLKREIKACIRRDTAYVIRIPGHLGSLLAKELTKNNIKYATEVVGDPQEVAKFVKLPYLFKLFYSIQSFYRMKKIVRNSIGALYVTNTVLQNKYPVLKGRISESASNVIIYKNQISDIKDRLSTFEEVSNRLENDKLKSVKIGVVGMLYYVKSPIEIVKAVHILISEMKMNVELHFAGDGPLMPQIKKTAQNLNMNSNVICHGSIASGTAILEFLDSIDLYIQFSRTEGLPRAMIEAMARGCPIIASNVGGIPDLIPEDLLVNSGNYKELAFSIKKLLKNEQRLKQAVFENNNRAKNFVAEKLEKKRSNFYSQIFKVYNQ